MVAEGEAIVETSAGVPVAAGIDVLDLLDAAGEDRRCRGDGVFGEVAMEVGLPVLKVVRVKAIEIDVHGVGQGLLEVGVTNPDQERVGRIGVRVEVAGQ